MPENSGDKSAELADERAKLWALWHGFQDNDEFEEWDQEAERERLAELTSKKGARG